MNLWGANNSGVAHGPVTVLVLVVTVVWVYEVVSKRPIEAVGGEEEVTIVDPDDVNVLVG